MKKIIVSGSFDNLKSRQVRFLEEASKLGELYVQLWSDEAVRAMEGHDPKFPQEERVYLLQAIRYVSQVALTDLMVGRDMIPVPQNFLPDAWVVDEPDASLQKEFFCRSTGIEYQVIKDEQLKGFPWTEPTNLGAPSLNKKVLVTGCYDWFHSGHVRFFEEASAFGDLYVLVGNDASVRFLKGEGHPLFSQEERRYMVNAVRYVKLAMYTSGHGWMDAEPDIPVIKPDIYLVNEDGDKPEKRELSLAYGMEYVVLKRAPREGLPRRESTNLRGY
jgi:cytidyltransferase-like protein